MNVRKPTPKQKIQVKYVPNNNGSCLTHYPANDKVKRIKIFWGMNYFVMPIKKLTVN